MKVKKIGNRRGQAAVELAILASLLLFAFSMILSLGQSIAANQQIKMEAFRRAMQKAYERNSSVSYTLKKNSRSANLNAPYGQGQNSTAQASASVMWQKGLPGEPGSEGENSFAFYQIDEWMAGDEDTGLPRYEKTTTDLSGYPRDIESPVGMWKDLTTRELGYDSTVKKQEDNAGISYEKEADLTDEARGTLYLRFDKTEYNAREEYEEPEYNYNKADPEDYRQEKDYHYERDWRVEHD